MRRVPTILSQSLVATLVIAVLLSGCSDSEPTQSGSIESPHPVDAADNDLSAEEIEFATAPADALPSVFAGLEVLLESEDADASEQELIQGLIGLGGSGSDYDGYVTQVIVVDAWRDAAGQVHKCELILLRPLEVGSVFREYREEVPTFGIVEFVVKMNPTDTRGVVLHVAPAEPDADLLAYAAELRLPVVEQTTFGVFTLDRQIDAFYGDVIWGSTPVRFSLPAVEDAINPTALVDAEVLLSNQAMWEQAALDFATEEMLELKNDGWLEEGEEPLTGQQFRDRLTLVSIDIDEGWLSFGFDDGDMFWGHTIFLNGTLEAGFADASLFG